MSPPPILAWRLFVDPPPGIWDHWYLLMLPLCLGVSIVYKSIKCESMRQVPREATIIFVSMVAGLVAVAAVLFGLVRIVLG